MSSRPDPPSDVAPPVRIEVLGPLRLVVHGSEATIGSPAVRRLLSLLVLRSSGPAPDELVDAVWPDAAPSATERSLANHAYRLRSVLGAGRPRWDGVGYRLDPSDYSDDRREFDRLAMSLVDGSADPRVAVDLADQALELWRGDPWQQLDHLDTAVFDRRRLVELRATIEESRCEALLRSGRAAEASATLAVLTADEPYRERRWWLRALALHRERRRRRSLAVIDDAIRQLAEAGLEPGRELRELGALIASDDPTLGGPALPGDPSSATAAARRTVASGPRPAALRTGQQGTGQLRMGQLRTGQQGTGQQGPDEWRTAEPRGAEPRLGRAGTGVRCRNGDHTFVGRSQELTELSTHALGVSTSSAMVIVEGEAGVGKTWLLEALIEQVDAHGGHVLQLRCAEDPVGPNQALSAAIDDWVARTPATRVAGLLGPLAPELARVSAGLVASFPDLGRSPDGDPEARRHRLLAALADLLQRLEEDGPAVVVIDDVHWGRDDTVALLRHCLPGGAGPRFVAAARPASERTMTVDRWLSQLITEGRSSTIQLSGLREHDVAELVERRVGRPEPEAAAAIHHQTGGNAFFVRELLEHRLGLIEPDATLGGTSDTPASIAEVVRCRVARLPMECRSLLEVLAVAGPDSSIGVLEAVVPGALRWCSVAEQAWLVTLDADAHVVSFRHDIIRQSISEQLQPLRRLGLHDEIGRALEALDPVRSAGAIAGHFVAASDVDPARAVRALRHAAALERDAHDLTQAADHLAVARRLGVERRVIDRRQECELLIEEGDVRRRSGDRRHQDLLATASGMARGDGDGELMGEAALAYCRTGPTSTAGALDEDAVAIADEGLDAIGPDDSRTRAQLLAAASMLHTASPDKTRCRELFDAAEVIARRLGDDDVLGEVLANAYWTVDTLEMLDRRSEIGEELVGFGGEHGQLSVFEGLRIRFSVQLLRGQAAGAAATQSLMESMVVTTPEPFNRCVVLYQLGTLQVLRGELDELPDTIARCGTACSDAGLPSSRIVAVLSGLEFSMRHQQGRLHELWELLAAQVELQPGIPTWRAGVALAAAEVGDHDTILQQVDALSAKAFAAFPEDYIWTGGMTALGMAVASTGDARRAAAVYDRLKGHTSMVSWLGSGSMGPVDRALGDLASCTGRHELAERHHLVALALSRAWSAPGHQAWAELGLARVAVARGDAARARSLLRGAATAARSHDLAGVLADVVAAAHDLGCGPDDNGASADTPSADTPSADTTVDDMAFDENAKIAGAVPHHSTRAG